MYTARPTVSAIRTRPRARPRPADCQKVNWGFQTTYFFEASCTSPQTTRIPEVTRSEQKVLDCMLDLREVFGLELPEAEARVMRKRKRSYVASHDLFEANPKEEPARSIEFDMEGLLSDPLLTEISRTGRAPPVMDHFSFVEDPEGYQMKLIGPDEAQREEPRVFLQASSTQLWTVAMQALKSLSLIPERLLTEMRSFIRQLSIIFERFNKSWLIRRISQARAEQRSARSQAVSLSLPRLTPHLSGLLLEPSDLDMQADGTGSAKTGMFSLTTLPSSPSNSPVASDKESPESPLRTCLLSEKKINRPRKCSSQGKKLRNINFAPPRRRRGKEIPLSMSEEFGDQIRRSSYRALLVFA